MTSETLWMALQMYWIKVYLGSPNIFAHDAGKTLWGPHSKQNSDMFYIRKKSILVESANSMTAVERYHTAISRTYNIICKEASHLDSEEALKIAVKAINASVGHDSLVPKLMVFGALPRPGLPSDSPVPSNFQQATASARRHLPCPSSFFQDALRTRNGPDLTDRQKAPVGTPAFVYQPDKDK